MGLPGSHRLGEVEAAWTERGWQGLASLPGPWAVALTEEASRSVVVAHDAMGAMPSSGRRPFKEAF